MNAVVREPMLTRTRILIVVLIVLLAVSAVAWRSVAARSAYAEINMLDVGQGDAVFIQLPDTTQILIDGGPDASVLGQLADVMGPFDHTIDIVVATHGDSDHISGLIDVLERYQVGAIVDSGIEKDSATFREWAAAVTQEVGEGAEFIPADQPRQLLLGENASLTMLWPQESYFGRSFAAVNDYSVVTRFSYGQVDTLLTGDIERWTEDRLIASGVLTGSEILKVPLHGSNTSSSQAFLDAVHPDLALISVGAGNPYGHPDPAVLARFDALHIPYLRTDQEGRITIDTDGTTFWRVD